MVVYYKFYYISSTNWYVINKIIQYSFILLSKCHFIAISVCKLFEVIFVISLAFSLKKKKNRNTTQSPLRVWKTLKLIQILGKKNLQTDVTEILSVLLK